MDASQDTLVIDPVAMNIVNRVAEGSLVSGPYLFRGGVLLQGTLNGNGEIAGRLVIWHTGQLRGRVQVLGDLIVLGQLGLRSDSADPDTEVECHGTAYVAATGVSTGTIVATRLRMYDGSVLQGPFRTLRTDRILPVLDSKLHE
jgi:cytoskeletal protein CcmA (bactofilin family)